MIIDKWGGGYWIKSEGQEKFLGEEGVLHEASQSVSTKLVKGGGGFPRSLSTIFCTKLVKNVFCTMVVNERETFFARWLSIVFLAQEGAKKERMWRIFNANSY